MNTPPPTVSLATDLDAGVISEILEETQGWLNAKGIGQWPFAFTPEWIRLCLEKREFFLARLDQVAVGLFRLLESDPTFWGENSGDAMYLHSLTVRRGWKGRGIGRCLIGWAEEYAARHHRLYLRLDCMAENAALCRYYEQAGFVDCGIKEMPIRNLRWKARLFQKTVIPTASSRPAPATAPAGRGGI